MSRTQIETRLTQREETRARVVDAEKRTIRGYGIVFDKESVDLRAGGRVFKEVIRREAVNGVDFSQVLSMHNHRSERLIGNTASGTMRTGIDATGVWYEVDVPDSPTGQDVLVSVQRGDTQGSSFQFDLRADGEKWSMKNGKAFREVVQFNGVYEMGPVSEPAYPDTSINARSLEALEAVCRDSSEKAYSVAMSANFIQQANWMIGDCNWKQEMCEHFCEVDMENCDLYEQAGEQCKVVIEGLKALIAIDAQIVAIVNGQRSKDEPQEAEVPSAEMLAMEADRELEQFQAQQF